MFIYIVTVYVKDSGIDLFIDATSELIRHTSYEPQNYRFDFLKIIDSTNSFILYEAYFSEDSLEEHHRTEHYKKWKSIVDPIMQKAREHIRCSAISPADHQKW